MTKTTAKGLEQSIFLQKPDGFSQNGVSFFYFWNFSHWDLFDIWYL